MVVIFSISFSNFCGLKIAEKCGSLLEQVRSIRMSGSCALNLCGVACGRLDLFYELGFGGPW